MSERRRSPRKQQPQTVESSDPEPTPKPQSMGKRRSPNDMNQAFSSTPKRKKSSKNKAPNQNDVPPSLTQQPKETKPDPSPAPQPEVQDETFLAEKAEDEFFGNPENPRISSKIIRTTGLQIDPTGNVRFFFSTAKRRFGIIIQLDGCSTPRWYHVRRARHELLQSSEKFGAERVVPSESDGRTLVYIRPEYGCCPAREDVMEMKHMSFQLSQNELILKARVAGPQEAHFAFTLRMSLGSFKAHTEAGFTSLGTSQCMALNDMLSLLEPGSEITRLDFLSVLGFLRQKHNNVYVDELVPNIFAVSLRPTHIQNDNAPPALIRDAMRALMERSFHAMAERIMMSFFSEMRSPSPEKFDIARAPPKAVPEGPDEEIDPSSPEACSVCYANRINTCIIDCGHACLCVTCSRSLYENQGDKWVCPKCREPIVRIMRMYK